jgi:hypothetical protein
LTFGSILGTADVSTHHFDFQPTEVHLLTNAVQREIAFRTCGSPTRGSLYILRESSESGNLNSFQTMKSVCQENSNILWNNLWVQIIGA